MSIVAPSTRARAVLPFPAQVDAVQLATASAETYTVPDGTDLIVAIADILCYARISGTATVPAGDVADGTASFPLPAGVPMEFTVPQGGALSIIRTGASTATVVIARYSR